MTAPAYIPEHEPTFTIQRHVALARKDMGEARWNELNDEWNAASLLCRTAGDIAAAKHDAWAGFASDLLFGSEEDKATARARYDRKMAAIAALEAQ